MVKDTDEENEHGTSNKNESTQGSVYINGTELAGMSEKQKAELRMKNIGFIFQGFYLNPNLNALDNVIVPMLINPEFKDKKNEKTEQRNC